MSFDWLAAELSQWRDAGLLRMRRAIVPRDDGSVELDGRRLVNLAGNDYLGLAADPRLRAAATAAIDNAGFGARASALVSGRSIWHDQLERRIARFEGQDAALLFPSGYAANLGTIAALAGAEDAVFCDRLNHASLIDGCRLSGARFRVYPHLDLETLERELHKSAACRRRLIATDAVFSMDGDVAPLAELDRLAARFDAMLLVDEAHATGVLGERGRGWSEELGISDERSVRVGTLSKALGSMGGFVAGRADLIDWLWNTARSQVFSTALPAAAAAAALKAVDLVEAEPERRLRLRDMSRSLREALLSRGLRLPATRVATPIIPVLVPDERAVLRAADRLMTAGFLVAAIRPPSVPRGGSRLRLSLHANLLPADLARLPEAIAGAVLE